MRDNASCRMLIRLWNSKLEQWDTEEVTVPGKPGIGPSDEYLIVSDSFVEPDENGNFINESYTEEELDAVHAFATARLTIDLWENALGHIISWPWCNSIEDRMCIHLYNELVDAVFRKSEQAIIFGTTGNPPKYTCKSFDIVSHETTHAIIESVLPSIHENAGELQYTLVESASDLSPILVQTSIPGLLKKAIRDTHKNLMETSFISEFGEGFGINKNEIRNALFPELNADNYYQRSTIITNFIYVWLVNLITLSKKYSKSKASKNNSFIIKNLLSAIKYRNQNSLFRLFQNHVSKAQPLHPQQS